MPTEPPWQRTHLAVPRADERLLAVPGFDETAEAAQANARLFDGCEIDIQGRPLHRLRDWTRSETVRLAKEFTSDRLNDVLAEADPTLPLVVAGHQPALYHPGVWAKNFAAAGIARRIAGAVLNLVVDNDIYSRPAIDAPAGTREEPRREAIAFDRVQRPRPWEGASIDDAALFASFGDRTTAHMRRWKIDPLIGRHWHRAVDELRRGGTLPECLTAVRHDVEAAWNLHNLELPMRALCESEPFLWFAGHLLAQLPAFSEIYNGALDEYRGLYRIKSRNHPVPALEVRDEWFEAPFWVWHDEAPHRRRVFAKQSGKQTTLADDTGHVFAVLPLSPAMDACCAVEVLRTLPSQGVRFRTRALTTTLFARLFLADTFVHGIGGAKYDELTDRIIARFFGIAPPAFSTVSASLFLPFAEPFDVTRDDERRLVTLLRDLEQNPQRHLEASSQSDPELARLLREKADLIAEQDKSGSAQGLSKRQRRERSSDNGRRFARLRQITTELSSRLDHQRDRAREELTGVRRRLKANQVLASREFSFALYPEEKLRGFLSVLRGES